MNYKNAMLFCEDFSFRRGGFSTENGRFANVLKEAEGAVDLRGAYVIPGLIDVHNHGNSGTDFSDGDYDGTLRMARYLAANGVTSFAPATLTLPYEAIGKALSVGLRIKKEAPAGASRLLGVHMEGPFFSAKKKGAQNEAYLRLPDYSAFKELYDAGEGLIRIVDLAPELEGAADFIRQACRDCTVSIAHTDASYDEAKAAIAAGVTHLTHLYNAMPPLHHRMPGVIAAAAESGKVRAEVICDGMHVHPAMIRLAFRIFGPERMILVSDALRCCGMPDGAYMLAGQTVYLRENVAKLADGTLAGAAANLYRCMQNAIAFGIPAPDAIRAATWNPACAVGAEKEVGSISDGKFADFVICDEKFRRLAVYLNGERVPQL